jgi:hypothetical protein
MSKVFLTSKDLTILGNGYLVTEGNKPVCNAEFVIAQRNADYVVKFAEAIKGKDFKGKEAVCLETFKAEFNSSFNKENVVNHLAVPTAPVRSINNQLKEEALAWVNYQGEKESNEKANAFLQRFNVIAEFEEFGLFFESEVCKLNKIYTMEEIKEAVKATVNLV